MLIKDLRLFHQWSNMKIRPLITDQNFRRTLDFGDFLRSLVRSLKLKFLQPMRRSMRMLMLSSTSNYEDFQLSALRSSRPTVFYKKVVLNNFEKITGKQVCRTLILALKRLAGSFWLPCGFSKNVTSKDRVKPWFFVTLLS